MDTALKLSQYAASIGSDVRVIGVPKTIDNDLCLTDHTPGFGSAAKYIASTILEIAHDTFSYPVPSVTIVEIMGRDAGWLTSASALARNEYNTAPHLIYLPEAPFDTAQAPHVLAFQVGTAAPAIDFQGYSVLARFQLIGNIPFCRGFRTLVIS